MTASNGARRIGMADIQEIREATGAFRVLDNRFGGGRIRISWTGEGIGGE